MTVWQQGRWRQKGEGMPSVSEEKQINTTKALFGGGVNVSAGATLLMKAGALSLTQKKSIHAADPPETRTHRCFCADTEKRWLHLESVTHLQQLKKGGKEEGALLEYVSTCACVYVCARVCACV